MPKLFTIRELAESNRLAGNPSIHTVRNMIKDGRLNTVDVGTEKLARWMVKEEEVERFNKNVLAK